MCHCTWSEICTLFLVVPWMKSDCEVLAAPLLLDVSMSLGRLFLLSGLRPADVRADPRAASSSGCSSECLADSGCTISSVLLEAPPCCGICAPFSRLEETKLGEQPPIAGNAAPFFGAAPLIQMDPDPPPIAGNRGLRAALLLVSAKERLANSPSGCPLGAARFFLIARSEERV